MHSHHTAMFYSKVTPVLRVSGGDIVLPQWCSLQLLEKKRDMLHIHLMRVFLGAPRIEPQGQVNSIFLCSIKDEARKKREKKILYSILVIMATFSLFTP